VHHEILKEALCLTHKHESGTAKGMGLLVAKHLDQSNNLTNE
jgi:hypothetical protein